MELSLSYRPCGTGLIALFSALPANGRLRQVLSLLKMVDDMKKAPGPQNAFWGRKQKTGM